MAWPKRRRIRRAPFALGVLLAAGLAAALALDARGRLPDLRPLGVPLLVAWWLFASALLAWGLAGLARHRWTLLPRGLGAAAVVFAAGLAARSLGAAG